MEAIIAAICSAVAAIVGAGMGYRANRDKTAAERENISETNKVLVYKVDELIDDVRNLANKLDSYKQEVINLSLKVSRLETEHQAFEKRLTDLEHSS